MKPIAYSSLVGEAKDQFDHRIAYLLGEEFASDDHVATTELENQIQLAHAGPVRQWIPQIRHQLEQMQTAEEFLAANPIASAEADVREKSSAESTAAVKLSEAQAAYAQIEAARKAAENRLRLAKEATTTLNPQDVLVAKAWHAFTTLRSDDHVTAN